MTEQDALAAVCDEHGIDLRRLTASHMERPPIGSLPQVIRDRVAAKLAAANAAELAVADEHPQLADFRQALRAAGHPTA